MRIRGNIVGNLAPRTNWEQTDPTKADYLKGRDALEMLIRNTGENAKTEAVNVANNAKTAADNAQAAADNAQVAADNAQTSADNALTAAENALKDSKDYTKDYCDSKRLSFSVTLTTNDWVGDAAPYKQTIGIEGILGTDRPHYGPIYSEDIATMLAEKEAWMLVDDLDTADGSVTFTCLEDKPKTSVAVQMEVHR